MSSAIARAATSGRRPGLLAGPGLASVVTAALLLSGGPEPTGAVPTGPERTGPAPTAAGAAAPPARVEPAGAIPAGADVPEALRGPIDDAARRCPEPEITPVLLAAMLKAESGFDPRAASPATGEYGVAMWTPTVFTAWAQDGDHDGVKDYMDPADAIASMGN
ncbi:lytic murein transglycosylase [Kitasatospora purpeofusca]|uniref:lytic murein transglycosylase n=1 Tax=Kitasatospora purpeofusca TaxID=67352 RepID=UPI003868609B